MDKLVVSKNKFDNITLAGLEELIEFRTYINDRYKNITINSNDDMAMFKNNRAELNKVIVKLSKKERDIKESLINVYKQYFDMYDESLNDITFCRDNIDLSIKELEKLEKIEKKSTIYKYFNNNLKDFGVDIDDIYNKKWENKTCSSWKKELNDIIFEKLSEGVNSHMADDYHYFIIRTEQKKYSDIFNFIENNNLESFNSGSIDEIKKFNF